MNEIIAQLPHDNPGSEEIKSYIQMLRTDVKGEDVQSYLEKIPVQLKALYEKKEKK